ncbi:cation diffusion facilitator family transporter [Brumimicrobium oceani]|uniref:Cation transporter n=1 Tax=Brumimicrobium oceani TaxID=2100725 RepID=A0A2U2XF91_9FLAO|nr:cation diffusion facilitator family transporter [Brumimicrobium oceani]PWH86469.1 cation transporter [Brumimicrobium oceani]
MSHNHSHDHSSTKNLKLAFWMNLGFSIFEIIGGIYVNSVAIISDAIHDLGDSLSLGSAWYLENKSKQKADSKFSFGYARYSLLGALINSIILILGSGFVIYAAIERLVNPEESDALGMIVFALMGVLVNGIVVLKMRSSSSMNEKVVYWHMLEDVLGWVAVLIAAIVIYFYPTPYIDPILSLAITAYILYGVIGRLKETLYFFLQGVPKEIDLAQIQREILAIAKVKDMHHTHVWSLDGDHHVFSTHLRLEKLHSLDEITSVKEKVKTLLKDKKFSHCTIETELDDETCLFD